MGQKIYLSNYELKDATEMFFNKLSNINGKTEQIATWEACGRVTKEAVFSKMSSPFYNSSAMDGIAVKSERTIGATDKKPVVLNKGEDYVVVDTGDPIPKEFDSVIMIEDIVQIDDYSLKIFKSAVAWQHIRALGEDIVQNSLIVPSNHVIRPVDIGAMIAGGIYEVGVYSKPSVGIIPTGTELVEPGTELEIGDIVEFNSRTFAAQVEAWGGCANRYNIVEDDYNKIKNKVKEAAENNDIVLINAGSSAGREDFTAKVIGELGEVILHGVAIKPGKPVILGIVNNKPVIGIPGYPVSAYFIMENIVKELICRYIGKKNRSLKEVDAVLSRRVMSSLKHLEFVRMKLGYVGDKLIATPLTRGAGATMSLVRADGVLEVPQNIEGIEAGEKIKVKLLKSEDEIKSTIVCIGSHDPIIDVLSDMIHVKNKERYLASAHVGSMGGIMALKKDETHIAPMHLLHMESGEYNIPDIKRYLSDKNIALIKCVKRIQGLIVPKGNPLNIKKIEDVSSRGLSFVNRQRGSGTRLLLDFMLKEKGIDSESIKGYEREEFTHLSVAAAVEAGDADCGLGVYSAADMMDLDFIPLCHEEYDLAVPEKFVESNMVEELIGVIRSEDFKGELERLGGYEFDNIGEVIRIKE